MGAVSQRSTGSSRAVRDPDRIGTATCSTGSPRPIDHNVEVEKGHRNINTLELDQMVITEAKADQLGVSSPGA